MAAAKPLFTAPKTETEAELAAESEKCAHIFKSGKRCTRQPVEGETVCVMHGGSEASASDSVRRRMLSLQTESLIIAEELLVIGDDATRARVCVAIWDRTGLGPKSTLEVIDKGDLSQLSREELAKKAEEAAARLRAYNPALTQVPSIVIKS